MAETPLVESYVDAGEILLGLLDDERVNPCAAMWLRDLEGNRWNLVLATPTAARKGPKAAYEEVLRVFRANEAKLMPLQADDLVVVEPGDPVVRAYSKIMRTGPKTARMRSFGNSVNGRLLPDGVVYRLQPPKAA